jgi:hypothetical protein
MADKKPTSFAEAAKEAPRSTAGEFLHYLSQNKKWWLTPVIVILLLLSLLVVLGTTGAAPFIYTLF